MLHVNKIKSHVDIIYLACRGEEVCHPIELFVMCLHRNVVFYLTKDNSKIHKPQVEVIKNLNIRMALNVLHVKSCTVNIKAVLLQHTTM